MNSARSITPHRRTLRRSKFLTTFVSSSRESLARSMRSVSKRARKMVASARILNASGLVKLAWPNRPLVLIPVVVPGEGRSNREMSERASVDGDKPREYRLDDLNGVRGVLRHPLNRKMGFDAVFPITRVSIGQGRQESAVR